MKAPESIAPEVVERMVAHIRTASKDHPFRPVRSERAQALWDEMQAIAALLPKPVDPDLLEARAIVAAQYAGLMPPPSHLERDALSGNGDDWFQMKCTVAAIKRGRELALLRTRSEGDGK